jgi:hypothetical protein
MPHLRWKEYRVAAPFIIAMLLCATPLSYSETVFRPMPGLDLALQKNKSLQCIRNLHEISIAGRVWKNDHHRFPANFQEFTNELSSPALLYCPKNLRDAPHPTNFTDVSWENIDYIWTPPSTDDPAEIISTCRIHSHTAQAGGLVIQGTERPGWSSFVAGAIRQDVTPGSDARFEVRLAPDATLPVHFQWRREDVYYVTNVNFITDHEHPEGGFWQTNRTAKFTVTPLPNQTNAVLLLDNVKTNDAAYYTVTASNVMGRSFYERTQLKVRDDVATMTNESTSRLICRVNLSQIGLLARLWAGEHGERMPRAFAEMTNRFGSPMFGWPLVLFCRSDTSRTAPVDWPNFKFENTSYETVSGDDQNLYAVFCRCKVHGYYVEMSGRAVAGPRFGDTLFTNNNSVELTLDLFAARTNILESSTNFTSWNTVATFANTNGPVPFPRSKTESHLFYRLRLAEDE